jgi:hypothetical protein
VIAGACAPRAACSTCRWRRPRTNEVKWGDGDHLPRRPHAAQRRTCRFVDNVRDRAREGSIEPVLDGNPSNGGTSTARNASLAFASAPLVTTITSSRPRVPPARSGALSRGGRRAMGRWHRNFFYASGSRNERRPIAFETVHAEDVAFAATLPVHLDAGHNLDLGTLDDPYYWFLATSRPIGRANPGPRRHRAHRAAVAPATVPWFGSTPMARRSWRAPSRLARGFPESMTTILGPGGSWSRRDRRRHRRADGEGERTSRQRGPAVGQRRRLVQCVSRACSETSRRLTRRPTRRPGRPARGCCRARAAGKRHRDPRTSRRPDGRTGIDGGWLVPARDQERADPLRPGFVRRGRGLSSLVAMELRVRGGDLHVV